MSVAEMCPAKSQSYHMFPTTSAGQAQAAAQRLGLENQSV